MEQRKRICDFIIIGVRKGGTESAVHNLRQHPDISLPPIKNEVHFFNKYYDKGLDWYRKYFNYKKKCVGEKTVEYIYTPEAIQRIHQLIPDVKLIIFLRNPIDRLQSDFYMKKRLGKISEDVTFDDIVDEHINNPHIDRHAFFKIGYYIDQIEYILKYFKRDQIYFCISEKCRKHPQKEYQKIFKFLGLKKFKVKYEPQHMGKYQQMNQETRKKLGNLYSDYNDRLYKFLGGSIKEWEE